VSVARHRAPAQIRLRSPSVSEAHALMLVAPGRAYVRDLASKTRLYVNDEVVREAPLQTGDIIRVGRFNFCVRDASAEGGEDAQTPVINLRIDGRMRRCSGRVVLIGSRAGCDVLLQGSSILQVHTALISIDRKWHVRDLGLGAKTFVNSVEVEHQTELKEGDVLRIGTTEVCLAAPGTDPDALQSEGASIEAIAARDCDVAGPALARVCSFNELTRRLRDQPEKRAPARGGVRRTLLWAGLGAVVCGAVAAVLHVWNV
jgi:pSer/pThr/pTyr-binding forkhead associated (FHA) protein